MNKPYSRERRPHSSTFIGQTNQKDIDMYSRILSTNPKSKAKITSKPAKEASKKKVNKRVRSASPGTLKNYLPQKQTNYASKQKPQRAIGGDLYHPTANKITTTSQTRKDRNEKKTSKNLFYKGMRATN